MTNGHVEARLKGLTPTDGPGSRFSRGGRVVVILGYNKAGKPTPPGRGKLEIRDVNSFDIDQGAMDFFHGWFESALPAPNLVAGTVDTAGAARGDDS